MSDDLKPQDCFCVTLAGCSNIWRTQSACGVANICVCDGSDCKISYKCLINQELSDKDMRIAKKNMQSTVLFLS